MIENIMILDVLQNGKVKTVRQKQVVDIIHNPVQDVHRQVIAAIQRKIDIRSVFTTVRNSE